MWRNLILLEFALEILYLKSSQFRDWDCELVNYSVINNQRDLLKPNCLFHVTYKNKLL